MIPLRNSLPEDAADWKDVTVSLPRLNDDSARSCPETTDEIMAYVRLESGDLNDADPRRLTFLRSAVIEKDSFWLWRYEESDGMQCYVTFCLSADGSTSLGLSEPNGLSSEQYLLAVYYGEVYWS